ncbi:MAG: phosphatase-like protein [Belnapia sp.]|nr:phosphatase-like protein [Belnapia sp.]
MIRRRTLLAAGAAGLASPALGQAFDPGQGAGPIHRNALEPLALPVKQDDTLARGYRRDVLVRWGDRVTFDAPRWTPRTPDPDGVAGQFGWDARVAGIAVPQQPAADGVARAILAVLHPTVEPRMAFPGGADQPAAAVAMQGASLLNIEKQGSRWVVVDGGYQSRRLGGSTLCRISGAGGGSGAVRGLLGLAGGCVTPWGTLLLAEGDPAFWQGRLAGLDPAFADGSGFGYVAELNPFDPQAVPVKRRALGRFAHGDVAAALGRDGRAVVYMTDRRVGGFLFRFVSAGPATAEAGLGEGRLFVARLEGDRAIWLALPPGAEAAPQAAAQQAGGSPLDTPSGLGLDPNGPRLLLACHGSQARPAGHVLEFSAAGGDDAADSASVRLLFAAGDPRSPQARYGGQGLPAGSAWPENPDTVTVDGRGRAWIGTDRGGRIGVQAEGLYVCDLAGPARGVPLPIYGAPRGGSIGGAAFTPDGEALFTAIRHPGAEPGASFDRPGTRWPEFLAGVPPRSVLAGLARVGGGPVGG